MGDIEHGIHVHTVKGMGDIEHRALATLGFECFGNPLRRIAITTYHGLVRSIESRNTNLALLSLEKYSDLCLGCLEGDHSPTRLAALHQATAGTDELGRVLTGEHP